MYNDYDVVIIGGGIGGLTVGNYLVQNGLRTVIFEAQDHAGGYVTSFQRAGFTFDAGVTSFGSNGIVFPILQEIGLGNLNFRRVKRQLVTERFQARIDGSFEMVCDTLKKAFPDEKEQIMDFFKWLDVTSEGFQTLFQTHLFLEEWRQALFDIIKLPFKEFPFCKFLWQALHMTDRDLYRIYFQDAELIDCLGHLGYPTMSGVVTAGMWYSFKEDYWYPIGGMGQFRDQLVHKYIEAGGEMYYLSKVEKILFADRQEVDGRFSLRSSQKYNKLNLGNVSGVRLTGGRKVRALRVVSNINPRDTYLRLVGEEWIEPAFAEKLRKGETSESICSLYLGLKGKGFSGARYLLDASHSTFYLRDEQGQALEFALYILTKEDPALAPDGEVLIIHCFDEFFEWVPSSSRSGEGYQTDIYRRKKEQKMEQMLGLARLVIPDIDQRIVVKELATPLTLHRYTGNSNGATAGWNWNPTLQPKFNWRKEGVIPGLDLVGCWILHPGGIPTSMLTAYWVTKKILNGFGKN